MTAIQTKFLPATTYRGARIAAVAHSGSRPYRLTIPYPYDKNVGEDAHRPAAEGLRDRLGWTGDLIAGRLPDGTYAFVFAEDDS